MRPETCLNTHRSSQRQSSHIISLHIQDYPKSFAAPLETKVTTYRNYKNGKLFTLPMVSWFSDKKMSRKSPSFPTLSNPLGRVVSPWPGRRLFPTRRCLDDVPLSKTTCSLVEIITIFSNIRTCLLNLVDEINHDTPCKCSPIPQLQ